MNIIICLLSVVLCAEVPALSSSEVAGNFSELGVDSVFKESPSDDPKHYNVEPGEYEAKLSKLVWMIPGPGSLPEEVVAQRSNNNVAIEFFERRIFMAFRTGRIHFANSKTRMYVISSADGVNWDMEWVSPTGRDAREPQLVSYNGKLNFYYFTAGTSPFKFEPSEVFHVTRNAFRSWTVPERVMEKGEVHWEMKVRNGQIWMTSYSGTHYRLGGGPARIKLHLKTSIDGKNFLNVDKAREAVSIGGVSEAGFELDEEGNLWSVTRNEDGDESGFGSHMAFAPSNRLSYWTMNSVPEGYQSPRMFRHGKDIYLIARRQKSNGPYGWAQRGGYAWRRIMNLAHYALTAKTTALYRMRQETMRLEHVIDLPGAGDTAFPSIRRVDAHTYLVANYTSSLKKKNRKWFIGQLGKTQIYLITVKFSKK